MPPVAGRRAVHRLALRLGLVGLLAAASVPALALDAPTLAGVVISPPPAGAAPRDDAATPAPSADGVRGLDDDVRVLSRAADGAGERVSPLVAQAIAAEHGEGVPRDLARAAELYCTAAREGDADGAFGLAWMVLNGRGMPHDDAIAAALFGRAAAAGHPYAQRMLDRLGASPGDLPDCIRPQAPAGDAVALIAPPLSERADDVDPFADLPPGKRRIADMVRKVAPGYAIEPGLALAVIATESNFDPLARSPKNATGLMQLIPETAARFKVRNPRDAKENVRGGLAYLRWLLSYYRGEVALAVAAYNAGEGAVDRYGGIPPFPETRLYVEKVLQLFRRAWHPFDPDLAPVSRAADPSSGVRSGTAGDPGIRGTMPASTPTTAVRPATTSSR